MKSFPDQECTLKTNRIFSFQASETVNENIQKYTWSAVVTFNLQSNIRNISDIRNENKHLKDRSQTHFGPVFTNIKTTCSVKLYLNLHV